MPWGRGCFPPGYVSSNAIVHINRKLELQPVAEVTATTFSKPVTISSSSQVAFQRLATLRFCWKILNILQGLGMFSAKSSAWSRTVIKPRLVDAEVTSGPKVPSRNKPWLHKSLAQKSLSSSSADKELNDFRVKDLAKMFKIFQQNRREASRWKAICEELEMVTGFLKVLTVQTFVCGTS